MSRTEKVGKKDVVILGAGLAGLSAGHVLSRAGRRVIVLEADAQVGGLSKTITHDGFRFDLGGHRFLTSDKPIERFLVDILQGDLLRVRRRSKIYMSKRYYDYPLRPFNAISGLGLSTTLQIIWDYGKARLQQALRPSPLISLEDWIVSQFGKKMFELYFKQYSEKVWGIDCAEISQEWVAQRIKGLSLWTAIKNALFRSSAKDVATLSDHFLYPPEGIGRISERLRESIERGNRVLTQTRVLKIHHDGELIRSAEARNASHVYEVEGDTFISSIPITKLLEMLTPSPPGDILEAGSRLKYRDMVIVAVMLDRERVTDNTWIYLPDKEMPIGRIHEPSNWSQKTAPAGKTHLVSEYFCFCGDHIWRLSDQEITSLTVRHLENLGFVQEGEIMDSRVVRVTHAYPVLDLPYRTHLHKILRFLKRFKNLHTVGRGGMFKYYNMDHAMASGISAAQEILRRDGVPAQGPAPAGSES